jgi:hypothetical protein
VKLIDRYMSAVAFHLPESRRDEITRELRANILDKLESLAEQQGREITEEDVSEVLRELGHPQRVANSFLPPQQLVTAELFPFYKQALNYGVIFMFVLELIKFGVLFTSSGHLAVAALLSGFVLKTLLMFASVTGVFYILSNPPGGKPLFKPYQCWVPGHLPPVIHNWQRISPCEQGIEFSSNLFFFLLLHYPLIMSDEVMATLTVGFAAPTQHWVPWLAAVVGCSLIFNVWNLRFSFWTRSKLMISATLNLVSAILMFCMSRLPAIIADSAAVSDERVISIELVNGVITTGFFWVGLWLLFECGRDLYRIWQLSRTL